jgi:hypothetical protein
VNWSGSWVHEQNVACDIIYASDPRHHSRLVHHHAAFDNSSVSRIVNISVHNYHVHWVTT